MITAERRATSRRTTSVVSVVVWLAVVVGCASEEPVALDPVDDVPDTVALGSFPDPLSGGATEGTVTDVTLVETTTTTTTTEVARAPITGPIGDEVAGNRILMIGDTVFQSTSPRSDGEMCAALEAFGWQAEIAAEVGRFVEFGGVVVDARVVPAEPEWDAAAIMLGNHFDGDLGSYRTELEALVNRLSPRPLLVYTLVEDDTFEASLNEVIRGLRGDHPNVVILDWAEIAGAEPELLLDDTPSGLSELGRDRLALFTAAALGEPPTDEGAGCVPPVFTDDSAIVL